MSIAQLTASSENYNKLITPTDSYYVIPEYQRDYSWDKEQWEELWQDISELTTEDGFHYLGYFIFQQKKQESEDSTKTKSFIEIIDGQQRLVTLSLFFAALGAVLYQTNTDFDIESFKKEYLLIESRQSKLRTTKLQLNKQSKVFYNEFLTLRDSPHSFSLPRDTKKPNRLLWEGFQFFYKKFKDVLTQADGYAHLLSLSEELSPKLEFTVIRVQDELDAYKVFETLNSRGVQLSAADLIKNYLFRIASKADTLVDNGQEISNHLEQMIAYWDDFVSRIETKELTKIILWYWEAKTGSSIIEKRLFKAIKNTINLESQKAFEFIKELNLVSQLYQSVTKAEGRYFNKRDEQWFNELGFTQAYPLLFSVALAPTNTPEKLKTLLKFVNHINLRTITLAGKSPNSLEALYPRLAFNIIEGSYRTAGDIQYELNANQRLQVSLASVVENLQQKPFTTAKKDKTLAKQLLLYLEHQSPLLLHDEQQTTLEHIVPISSNQNQEACLLLGNFCLLSRKQNQDARGLPYPQKKAIYLNSNFSETRLIGDTFQEFTTDTIHQRTQHLAEKLLHCLSLN